MLWSPLGKLVISGERKVSARNCIMLCCTRHEEEKSAAKNGQTTIAVLYSQSVYNASFEGWNGFVDYRQLF